MMIGSRHGLVSHLCDTAICKLLVRRSNSLAMICIPTPCSTLRRCRGDETARRLSAGTPWDHATKQGNRLILSYGAITGKLPRLTRQEHLSIFVHPPLITLGPSGLPGKEPLASLEYLSSLVGLRSSQRQLTRAVTCRSSLVCPLAQETVGQRNVRYNLPWSTGEYYASSLSHLFAIGVRCFHSGVLN